jgi:hypothetical protein
MLLHNRQISEKQGPAYNYWRKRVDQATMERAQLLQRLSEQAANARQ